MRNTYCKYLSNSQQLLELNKLIKNNNKKKLTKKKITLDYY